MFYSPELLSLRKKGKLSRCWLAGTLSDKLFKKTVSNKIVLSIDIQVTCNEILKYINSKSGNRHSRFSLYMSAQLMFGAVKLFRIQAKLFEDSLFRAKADLNPIDLAPRKRKRTGEIDLHDEHMIEPPPIEFGNLQRADQHLLIEAHYEMLGDAAFRDYVESPNFGALTEEEMGVILFNDGDIRMFGTPDDHGSTIDKSKELPRSPGQTTVTHTLGLSDAIPAIEESTNAEITAQRISTPRKRPSSAINLDTPTKKLRQGFRPEIDSLAEKRLEDVAAAFPADAGIQPHDEIAAVQPHDEIAAVQPHDEFAAVPPHDEFAAVQPHDEIAAVQPHDEIAAVQPHDEIAAVQPHDEIAAVQPHDGFANIPPDVETRPPDRFVEPLADVAIPQLDESIRLPPEAGVIPALPAQEHTVDPSVAVDRNLHLESLESEPSRVPRVRRGRIINHIDEITVMPNRMIGKSLFGYPSVHTTEFVPPVTDRERGMLANALLLNPTTNRRCSRAVDSSRWAQKLFEEFEMRIMGPFVAENDGSMSAEAIRFAESGTQTGSVEISKKHGETTTEPSSRNKTVEEPIPVDYDSKIEPVVPDVTGNVSGPPMDVALANITDEPMLANISQAQEDLLPPEIEIPPIPQNILNDRSEAQELDLPPEVEIPPIPQNGLDVTSGARTVTYTKTVQSDGRSKTEKSSFDTNTGDLDAFLPSKLRTMSVVKKESQKKSSSSEVIVDISDSPTSNRSEQSDAPNTWIIPELMAFLEVMWNDDPIVKFEDIVPPDGTRRRDAAACFVMLLELKKSRHVLLEQREAYGTIYITKRTADSRMDLDEA